MFLFKTGSPRKTTRKRCVKQKAKVKAKNRRRRERLKR